MKRTSSLRLPATILAIACVVVAIAQAPVNSPPKPGRYTIQIFHVVPGKAVDFLKFNADREGIRNEAGAPPKQWYRHSDGADWDYLSITPLVPPEEETALQARIDAVTRQHHETVGAAGGMALRALLLDHTDTYVVGPMTAAQLLKEVQ
jgi:hypothetical protein